MKNPAGFTLIEILIAMALTGVFLLGAGTIGNWSAMSRINFSQDNEFDRLVLMIAKQLSSPLVCDGSTPLPFTLAGYTYDATAPKPQIQIRQINGPGGTVLAYGPTSPTTPGLIPNNLTMKVTQLYLNDLQPLDPQYSRLVGSIHLEATKNGMPTSGTSANPNKKAINTNIVPRQADIPVVLDASYVAPVVTIQDYCLVPF